MVGHDLDRGSDRVLRDLVLVVESEPDDDLDRFDRLVHQLRTELDDLEIESVTSAVSEDAPSGAKGVEPVTLGVLLVTLSATGGVFTTLIEAARDWLARHSVARRISVTIDGDTIVLEKSSALERSALIDAYIRRHEVE